MDASEITSWLQANLPETILLVGGILAIAIALCYVKDKESLKYKALVFLGVLFGIFMVLTAMRSYEEWRSVTAIIISIAAFALIIRPFREVHFAVIFALLIMAVVYIWMGGLNGYMLFDNIDLSALAEGWPRVIAAFLIGSVFYMIFHFIEAIVQLFGKILNFWPVLFILGAVCIVESLFMFMGYGSIMDYIDTSSIESALEA